MPHPFRFGVQVGSLPADGWQERVRRIEALGYSTLFVPDHFGPQWDPLVLCAAAASVSERLNVGTLVLDVDYRHPVIHAKAAATTQLLSGGRFEFGLGAGWMQSDYDEAGIDFDPPAVRLGRLEESLQICRSMWERDRTTFEGSHYRITDVAPAVTLGDVAPPKVLVGGGGRRLLAVAGRHADIVGINPSLPGGAVTAQTPLDLTPERVAEKVAWVRQAAEAAGRDPDTLELQTMAFAVSVVDDPAPIRQGIASGTGMSVEQVADCPLFLVGSAAEIRDRLCARRERTGISYIVIQAQGGTRALEEFAEAVVSPLAGT